MYVLPGDITQLRRPGKEEGMSKPSIVLVHGFWGGAAHWAKVIVELNRRGYDSLHAVENPLTSLPDDAARTQKMLKQVDGPVQLNPAPPRPSRAKKRALWAARKVSIPVT
jgi:hypothetical protein